MASLSDTLNLSIHGFLSIVDNNGKPILAKKNLVVNSAKTVLTSALVGNPSGDYISYLAFGTGINAPLITDRGLYNQIYQVNVSYESQTAPFFEDQIEADGSTSQMATVVFSGIIPEDAEFTTTEAGLFSIKEFMFSRLVFPAILKQAGAAWLVRWYLNTRIV
jgi:hypothetical protein